MTGIKSIRYGKATITWVQPMYGPQRIVANAPADALDDLVEAVLLAKDHPLDELISHGQKR